MKMDLSSCQVSLLQLVTAQEEKEEKEEKLQEKQTTQVGVLWGRKGTKTVTAREAMTHFLFQEFLEKVQTQV